jgi:hypothetical protein
MPRAARGMLRECSLCEAFLPLAPLWVSLSLLLRASSFCVLTCATRLYEGATTAAEGAAADNAAVVAETEEILEPMPDLSTPWAPQVRAQERLAEEVNVESEAGRSVTGLNNDSYVSRASRERENLWNMCCV